MELQLRRAGIEDAKRIWEMQVESFADMYEKYRDEETSPAREPVEKVIMRLEQPFTYYYLIELGGEAVGALRVVDRKEAGRRKRISPLFILPAFRKRGLAQAAIREAEKRHGEHGWALDTILQEEGNCRLYEKMGYRRTEKQEVLNERMTLVFYEKE